MDVALTSMQLTSMQHGKPGLEKVCTHCSQLGLRLLAFCGNCFRNLMVPEC